MGRKGFLAIVWLSLALVPLVALAVTATAAEVKKTPQVSGNEPIEIVSDRMDAYHEKRMVIFSGNAVATQGARTVRSDRLIIYYKGDEEQPAGKSASKSTSPGEGTGAVERVEAKGHVRVTEGDRIVTGDEALFEEEDGKMTMMGNAVMREGPNVIKGDRIVVFLNENRGMVESSENKRVTATIYPNESKGKKP